MEKKLEDVAGIGKSTADKLKAAGIDTIEKLSTSTPEDLIKLKIKGFGNATASSFPFTFTQPADSLLSVTY